jgi:hypothetical protein
MLFNIFSFIFFPLANSHIFKGDQVKKFDKCHLFIKNVYFFFLNFLDTTTRLYLVTGLLV